jgi:hypothetical protein
MIHFGYHGRDASLCDLEVSLEHLPPKGCQPHFKLGPMRVFIKMSVLIPPAPKISKLEARWQGVGRRLLREKLCPLQASHPTTWGQLLGSA